MLLNEPWCCKIFTELGYLDVVQVTCYSRVISIFIAFRTHLWNEGKTVTGAEAISLSGVRGTCCSVEIFSGCDCQGLCVQLQRPTSRRGPALAACRAPAQRWC